MIIIGNLNEENYISWSSRNQTDRHDIAEILLQVTLNTKPSLKARQKINIYIHVFNLTINLEVVDNIHDNKDHEM
jgi:hypothetical protein